MITDPIQIQQAFLSQLQQLLGTQHETLMFDPPALYSQSNDLLNLDDPFTLEEVETAINKLAKNKASRPDGIPNEFLKIYWPHLREQIMAIVEGFYHGQVQLKEINKANVVMIPKKESPVSVGDFRSISVTNIIPKLLSKILANRLKAKMPDLISCNQTAFIKGRQIMDNFVATRELLQYIASSTNSVIFLKIDFAKAFDSINWDFLIRVMQARGFLFKWILWIKELLQSASSRVLINGEASEFFCHKRGL